MHSTITPIAFALSLLSLGVVVQGCESFGVDFQTGGSYFQNISSTDPFTFVSIYENCEDDVATNILVDPNGDEVQCSDTPLQPDDTNELSTCPLSKNEMWSGPWAVIIISNNGESGAPIAYEREFSLVVGTPTTTTYIPTISVTATSTPLSTSTSFSTTICSSTVTSTTVKPAKTRTPTKTITPTPITTTKTFGPTVKKTTWVFSPVVTTKTTTKTCKVSTQSHHDPTLTWRPTILPTALSAVASELGLIAARDIPSRRRDVPLGRRVPIDRVQRIAERKERLAAAKNIDKRGLDSATVTVTDTNTADWITTTSISLAPTSTITITSVVSVTKFTTSTTTIYSGTTTASTKYVTLPTKTVTKFKPTIFTTIVATITKKPVYTVTVSKKDPAATKLCSIKGGRMV